MSAVGTELATRVVCAGCGAALDPFDPFPFRCACANGDDVDHVLRRELDLNAVRFPFDELERNPFVRFRQLVHSYHVARARGLDDLEYVELVRALDARVAAVDGHGFAETPYARSDGLSDALGFSRDGGVWVKDETGNVSGSHKARHLFGVLVWLEVAERCGLTTERPDLAIASCGNAALAAAVVAAAGRRRLRVFVPPDADPAVLARLEELGAHVTACAREPGVAGDPTYHALLRALGEGALPFTCQGNLNGLAVEGGHTLAWELAERAVPIDRIVVQVGGGALASGVALGLGEALALDAIDHAPRIDTVQTTGAWPLKRAYDKVAEAGLAYARTHRSQFMWPWEEEPRSIAHGILDDETYDWVAVVEGMLDTGGTPVVADEETLRAAHELAHEATDIDVDPTGSSGLAGLIALRNAGDVHDDERVAVLFTGRTRSHPQKEE